MSFLHFFMILMFLIGLLLIILSFFAYSKIGYECKKTSSSLKTKLRVALGIGSTLLCLAIGFFICVTKSKCKCTFDNEFGKGKIYGLIGFCLMSGIGLLVLTFGIKSDLNEPDCKVDLGIIPWILGSIAIIQLLFSIVYITIHIKNYQSKEGKEGKEGKEDKEEESTPQKDELSHSEQSSKYDSEKEASEQIQKTILNTRLKAKQRDLSKINENILKYKHDTGKDPKQSDIEMQIRLRKDVKDINDDIGKIGQY